MVKRVGKYEIGKTLGEGTFGKVKYAVNTETGEKVAIKILDKEKIQKQNMGAQIKKEISIMKVVKHPHVVKLYEVLASRTKIFIVLELITGGELFDKIVAEGRFDDVTARFYFRQLIRGVKYCHSQGVCHRDLKPENLLLDANGDLKISDFGLSALYTGNADDEGRATLLHTTCGTPNYVAPEVLADRGYDGRAADIWSAGVILYVLLAGFLPFDEPHMSALFKKIQRAEFTYPAWFTPQVRDLIDRILVPDPAKRISIADIEAHAWFVGPDNYHDDGTDTSSMRLRGAAGPTGAAAMPAAASGSGGATMAHVPSAKDLEEAVMDVDDGFLADSSDKPKGGSGAAAASAGGAGGSGGAAAPSGARLLNAFDVVNMFGGMTLRKIVDGGSGAARGGSSSTFPAASPQFLSPFPAATILTRAAAALTSLGATVSVDEASAKVKGRVMTGRGEISISLVVYRMSDELHMVEVHRGRGDILEYNAIYTKARELLADIILRK